MIYEQRANPVIDKRVQGLRSSRVIVFNRFSKYLYDIGTPKSGEVVEGQESKSIDGAVELLCKRDLAICPQLSHSV